eukprot:11167696-Lingulodinium_polyedra.AAC.1
MRPPRLSSRGSSSRMATASGGQASWHGQQQTTRRGSMACHQLNRRPSCTSRQGGADAQTRQLT